MKKKQYSLLVLRKASDKCFQTCPQPIENGNHYLTLGYFDSFSFYPNADEYDSSRHSYNADTCFVAQHPFRLYCADKTHARLQAVQTFQDDKESPFFFVTMVHLCSPLDAVTNEHLHDIEAYAEKYITDTLENPSTVLCYRSLELCNIVILWKHRNLLKAYHVMDTLKVLIPSICHTQTICGLTISNGALNTLKQMPEQCIPSIDIHIVHNHQISLTSLHQHFDELFQRSSRFESFTSAGVYDTVFRYENICAYNFTEALTGLERGTHPNLLAALKDAAISISSHIYYPSVSIKPSTIQITEGDKVLQFHNKLNQECQNLYHEFMEFAFRNSQNNYKSIRQNSQEVLAELVIHLVRMSENSVLDGVCCYLLRPARTFIHAVCAGQYSLNSDMEEKFNRFIRGWQLIVEQTIKVDGTYNQDPSFSLRMIALPARLLEFYSAFVWKIVQTTHQDDNRTELIQPDALPVLIYPRLCRRCKIHESQPNLASPQKILLIESPIDLIDTPADMLCVLTHEISHFVGSEIRCKAKRLEYLTTAFVIITAQILMVDTRYGRIWLLQYFQDMLKEQRETKKTQSAQKSKSFQELTEIKSHFFQSQLETLMTILKRFFADNLCTYAYYENVLVAENASGSDKKLTIREQSHQINSWIERFFQINQPMLVDHQFTAIEKTFSEIVREGYADLLMINLLNLDMIEYIRTFGQELKYIVIPTKDTDSEAERTSTPYALADFAQRVAAVIFTVYPNQCRNKTINLPADWGVDLPPLTVHEFDKMLNECLVRLSVPNADTREVAVNDKSRERREEHMYLHAEVYIILVKYLQICKSRIEEHLNKSELSDNLEIIRNLYTKVGRQEIFASDEFYTLLREYRSDLIHLESDR